MYCNWIITCRLSTIRSCVIAIIVGDWISWTHLVMKQEYYGRTVNTLAVDVVAYRDDAITWTHFPRFWPFVQGIHKSPVNSPDKDQWRGALMFYLICAWVNGWVNGREAGDWRHNRAHFDVSVIQRRLATLEKPQDTVKPVCNDHLYIKIYYLWFI